MKYEITKGSEKDFEGAPEWATLVTVTGLQRFFVEEHKACARVMNVSDGDVSTIDRNSSPIQFDDIEIIAERRPITEPVVTTEWDGKGLPPVGVICEWLPFSDEIRVVQIIAYHDGAVWLERRDKYNGIGELVGNPDNFRPIRSPDDVAREKITLSMLQYMYSSDETDYAQVCKIYDAIAAGEIPGVKLE